MRDIFKFVWGFATGSLDIVSEVGMVPHLFRFYFLSTFFWSGYDTERYLYEWIRI